MAVISMHMPSQKSFGELWTKRCFGSWTQSSSFQAASPRVNIKRENQHEQLHRHAENQPTHHVIRGKVDYIEVFSSAQNHMESNVMHVSEYQKMASWTKVII